MGEGMSHRKYTLESPRCRVIFQVQADPIQQEGWSSTEPGAPQKARHFC